MADFSGTTGDDSQDGTLGSDNFDFSQGGNDILAGKGGDDVFVMGGAFSDNDQIDGGGGFDDLVLDGATDVDFGATTLTNIERIEMFGPSAYVLTVDDATVSVGSTLEIFCGGSLTFDGSAEIDGVFAVASGNATDSVIGGRLGDEISTGQGADALFGGNGDDNLNGGDDGDADQIYGGDGNDTILFERNDAVFGGDGADLATLHLGGTIGSLDGGAGTDTLSIPMSSHVLVGSGEFSSVATSFEILTLSSNIDFKGDGAENVIDLSGFGGPTANQTLKFFGHGGADTLIGNVERDIIHGGGGANTLSGMDGNDRLTGGGKADVLTGGAGADVLVGKGGDDVFVYAGAADSTGRHFDTVAGFNGDGDAFDLASAVNVVDAAIGAGALSRQSFDGDLAAAVDAAQLAAHDAVLFTPDDGGFAGKTFLVVDLNGVAGYQTGEDLVVTLKDGAHLDDLSAANFI